ncbi:hypothetical protein EB796_004619 [Bugula neritina]|uniref:Uncharacterized protein n=1 Tax=Bugula neritina TaxID=10212 RepID=A0A7J7KHD0_BUGNE|nr:hypothetical protein EB796_004619 [Bugula neritina]
MTNMSVVEAPHSKKTIGQLSDIEKNPCWEASQTTSLNLNLRCLIGVYRKIILTRICAATLFKTIETVRSFGTVLLNRGKYRELSHLYHQIMTEPKLEHFTESSVAFSHPLNELSEDTEALSSDLLLKYKQYSFKEDGEFVDGWRHLSTSFKHQKDDALVARQLISAKLFYFSRKFNLTEKMSTLLKDEVLNSLTNQVDDFSSQQIETEAKGVDLAPQEQPPRPLSFKQVMEYIERGEEVPGAETIVVEPTNEPVTSCTKELPRKPWE